MQSKKKIFVHFCYFTLTIWPLQGIYDAPKNLTIQILQSHPMIIPVSKCLVVTTRRVYRCGMSSHAYGSQAIEFLKKSYPSRQDCMNMVETNVAILEGKMVILNANSTTSESWLTEGFMYATGGCDGVSFTRGSTLYEKSVETIEVNNR